MKFIEEFKKRNIIKTIGIYSAAALIIIQIADIVFPRLLLPDWTVTFIIVLVIIGFPVTFFLSWTYNLNPNSNVSSNSLEDKEQSDTTNQFSFIKKIIFPLTGLILTIIGCIFWFIYPFITFGIAHERDYDASIAILYMENMSSDENSYFAEGLTEELINRLGRIQNLRVRPRTDVAVYKNQTKTISEIAKELQVNYIVEGSVRIAGENLRVNAQLIDVIENKTVWSESYNNKLVNIFDVQDGIAEQIVSQLDKTLNISTTDLTATKRKSTDNLEAYNLIMQAFKHINNPIYTDQKRGERIEPLAQEALKLDSTYADAHAILALSKMFKWMTYESPGDDYPKDIFIKDINDAKLHVKIALQYDEDNLLGLTIITFLPLFADQEEFSANKIFILRSMMIDAQKILDKHPDNLLSQFTYAYYLFMRANIQGAPKEDYQDPLDRMLAILEKFKKTNFVLSHPTEGMALGQIMQSIPALYLHIGEGDKALDFIKNNKKYLCQDDTYDCLNATTLTQISNGFYFTFLYEDALFLINLITSRSEEELLFAGNTINVKKIPYYRTGMIYMKLGQYNKAIEGFTQALQLSFNSDERISSDPNQTWEAEFYRRLGLVYYYTGNYKKASEYYLKAYDRNKLSDGDRAAIKSICSYAYMELLSGNHVTAKKSVSECTEWLNNNPDKIKDDHDAYETYWPLHLYYNHIDNKIDAEKFLNLAYKSIEDKLIKKFHENPNRNTSPKYFWHRDIIKAYKNN